MATLRSCGEPLTGALAALLHGLPGIKGCHASGLMAAQSAKLRVGQIGVGTFGVAAVAQAHELGIGIDAGGDAYLGNTLPKVPGR